MTAPVNSYGRSKLAAEVFICKHFDNYLIFRSSLICGPPLALKRELFLQVRDTVCFDDIRLQHRSKTSQPQMLDDRLRLGPFPVFSDEWRSPIFIGDIVAVCTTIVEKKTAFPYSHRVFNLGGREGCVVAY